MGYIGIQANSAALWSGNASSAVVLGPVGYTASFAYATDGRTQVGVAWGPPTKAYQHAVIWHGTAASFQDINPTGYLSSQANGVSGELVAGQASNGSNSAVLWNLSNSSVVNLNPQGAISSSASAIVGTTEAGTVEFSSSNYHGVIWNGSATNYVDLGTGTFVNGMSSNQEVGTWDYPGTRAAMWSGSANSLVDLNGTLHGSVAYATNGREQVGEGDPAINGIDQGYHAVVWSGSSNYVDLSQFLPPAFANSTSVATAIDSNGDILGTAYYTYEAGSVGQSFLWAPVSVPEPASYGVLALASVLPGRRHRRRFPPPLKKLQPRNLLSFTLRLAWHG